MPYFRVAALISLAFLLTGCPSSSTTTPPVTTSPAATSEPKYEAVVAISTNPKGKGIVNCESDMAAVGEASCGLESSLAELSWQFTEHRDGSDYYKVSYTLTSRGDRKVNKAITIGFDGNRETTVIDAEQYIVIRKGPLNPELK